MTTRPAAHNPRADQLPFEQPVEAQLPFDDPVNASTAGAQAEAEGVDSGADGQPPPPDADARRRIRDDLGSTLFVEAGAGAGKTTSLVERIVTLVASGVPIVAIAAITFTEKAAAELRTRIRHELTHAVDDETAEATVRTRFSEALDRLDHAPIGTLHAFARRILFDFPIEAGLPPGFTVLDELESSLAFDERWDDLLDDLLGEEEPEGGLIAGGREFVELCEFDRLGIERGVRGIADDFAANWDLVEERVDLTDPGPTRLDLQAILAAVSEMEKATVPPDDPQARHLEAIRAVSGKLDHEAGLRRRLEILDELKKAASPARRGGQKARWKAHGGDEALEAQRARAVAVCDGVDATVDAVKGHRRLVLGAVLGRFVLEGSTARMRLGRLEFHDLLVLARRLLATRADIRAILHDRYQRVLLDEFQDTDPIQLEIAVRLTAPPDDPAQRGDWRALRPEAGRLFIVGDPKQSIYRFRRADISQYLRAADQLDAASVALSANFRSTRAVIDFTNAVFDELITFEADAQPAFQALDACRRASLLGHGSVTVLGADRHDDLDDTWRSDNDDGVADTLRMRESADVAAAITTALAEGWPVVDDGAVRVCRPGDICILLPSRLALASLETALRGARIPYRAENSSVVYATSEIRDLLLALRAADDPTDHLALVAVLRTPLYGCSDVELYEWRSGGGSWSLWAPPRDGLHDHPVAGAIAHVRSIAERIGWTTPADLLAAVADERRLLDLALDRPDARDVWRRVRFVIEQARAWADAGGHGIRRYLAWTRLQAAEGRISETILPEHDADAVRIMTVHAAKGLEFPITVVAGLTTKRIGRSGTRAVFADDDWMLSGRGDDGRFDAYASVDEQMGDAERRRLLYVACTRAVDHLVVSTHRAAPPKNNPEYHNRATLTSAELLFAAGAGEAPGVATRELQIETMATAPPAPLELDHSDPVVWAAERERALTSAARRTGVAATRLADELNAVGDGARIVDPGLDKYPVNIDLAPWRRGRYGTSIGRAVHGVLQFCDLDDGNDIGTLARAQCAAEGIIGLDGRVASLARSALGAPMVRAVVGGAPHWRELFVVAPVADRVLEGYVDLLVRTDHGLVIVDYKTDQWSGAAQAGERIARYRLQLAAYGVALEGVLGEPVIGGVLIRCRPDAPADEIEIDDWQQALDDVRQLMA